MADSPGPPARYRWLVVLIILIGWALRLHALGAKSLWYDELRQVEVAQRPLSQMSDLLIVHAARPLDYVLTHFWLAGLGPVDTANSRAEFWLRYPAALWGLLALAAFLPLARRWLRPITRAPAAPLAALTLFALAPLAVQYSQELRPYSLYLLLAVLSAYAFDRAWTQRRLQDWLALAALAVLGALTHFFFAMLVATQGVFVLAGVVVAALRRQPRWGDLLRFGLGAAAGGAALFVAARPAHLLLFAERFFGALAEAPAAGLVSDTGVVVAVNTVVNADFVFNGVLPFFGGGAGWALVLFVALAAVGLAALAQRSPARAAWGALWLLLGPALVIVYLQYRQQFFALRYILFALPSYLLLVSAGLAALAKWLGGYACVWWSRGKDNAISTGTPSRFGKGPGVRSLVAAALLLGVIGLGLLQFGEVRHDYAVPKDDWRRVGAFLTANVRPGDTLGAPDVQAFVRFYAPGQPAVIVDTSERGPHEQALANGERFWFVWSDYTLAPVDATRAWVSALPSVTLDLDPRIRVIFVHPGRTQAEMLAEAQDFVIPPPTLR